MAFTRDLKPSVGTTLTVTPDNAKELVLRLCEANKPPVKRNLVGADGQLWTRAYQNRPPNENQTVFPPYHNRGAAHELVGAGVVGRMVGEELSGVDECELRRG